MNCANHPQAPAAAYCRTCGKALCEVCKRDVMGAIYCEPCIAARLQVGAPIGAGAAGQVPPSGSPNLAAATLLGMIPGVGAMYNGQFLKALIHVGIFAALITLSNNVSGIFVLAIFFFWFYMVFDAYKTAQARLLGLPAPDLLGLHRLFGIHDEVTPAPVLLTAAASGIILCVTKYFVAPPTPSRRVAKSQSLRARPPMARRVPSGLKATLLVWFPLRAGKDSSTRPVRASRNSTTCDSSAQ